MLIPLRSWFILMMILLSASVIYYRAFEQIPLPSSEDERARTQLAERWAQKVASEVKRLPGRPVVAVARVVNDDGGILTGQLKKWIARRNVLMLNDQWYNGLSYSTGISDEPKSTDTAVQELLGANVDYIVAAEIANWTTYPEFEATLVGHVEIRDGRSGETVLEYQLSLPEMIEVVRTDNPVSDAMAVADSEAGSLSSRMPMLVRSTSSSRLAAVTDSTRGRDAEGSTVLVGLGIWLAMTVAFPLTWSKSLKKLLRQRSNHLNAALLFFWLLATSILAMLLWLHLLPLGVAVPLGVVAGVAAAVYFGFCCYHLEQSL